MVSGIEQERSTDIFLCKLAPATVSILHHHNYAQMQCMIQEQQSGADSGLESQQQDELALVQQQVSMAAKLLRAQADRLQVS